jgi:hypothetical protein
MIEPNSGDHDNEHATTLKALLRERHAQTYPTFKRLYEKTAKSIDSALVKTCPAPRQYYRWLNGEISGLPYPGARSVLEAMFPGYSAEQLFAPWNEPVSAAPIINLAQPSSPNEYRHDSINDLRDVLTDYQSQFRGIANIGQEPPPVTLSDLRRDLTIAFGEYQQSRFSIAASRISTLLRDAHATTSESEQAEAFAILALSYQAAASILIKVEDASLAWIAAERGLAAAERSGNEAVIGSLIRSVAFSLLSSGHLEPAMRLIESGARLLEPALKRDDARLLSVYGMLFLAGSMASARFGDSARTADYLHEAATAAGRIGEDANHLWTAFGPTNVAIHRANTAAELGDVATVLNYGTALDTRGLPLERQVRHLLDVARAFGQVGDRDSALGTMIRAERMAPEQVRRHHLSRTVVAGLVESSPTKPSIELDRLAQRICYRGNLAHEQS